MTRARAAALSSALLASTGCALPVTPSPSGGTLYQGTTDGVQYRSALPRDVKLAPGPPRQATGLACRTSLALPPDPPTPFYGSNYAVQLLALKQPFYILWGDAGFATAMEDAQRSVQNAPLYDVRVDMHTTTVLSILRRDCLEIHAAAAAR